ncbi:MAG: hypothetical protein KJP01_05705 [Gramella sp.]|nr:hypothetical protein [Christiangramia sp.]
MAPDDAQWSTQFFAIESGDFLDVKFFIYNICVKLLIISFLLIWFITNNHWWRHVILVPLIIEIYKLLGLLNPAVSFYDEIEYIVSLPVTIPLILLLIWLSYRIITYNQVRKLLHNLNSEADKLIIEIFDQKISSIESLKSRLNELKQEKHLISKDQYLSKLDELKESLNQI